MTTYDAAEGMTLGEARDDYFRANGFGPDGGYDDAWVDFRLGPIPMPFPNTAGRKRAVRFHDLHHVLTGYATDLRGELEISAWELGSGCAGYLAAWQLNLGGLVAGLLACPRRTWRAFLRGRSSRNLYRGVAYDAALLGRRVGEVRRELGLGSERRVGDGSNAGGGDRGPGHPRTSVADVAWLAALAGAGAAVGSVMFVLMIPAALVANAAAWSSRRQRNTART